MSMLVELGLLLPSLITEGKYGASSTEAFFSPLFDVSLVAEEKLSETVGSYAEIGKGAGNYLCCLHAH